MFISKPKSITAACCLFLAISTANTNAFTFTQKAVGVDRWIGQWKNQSTSINIYKQNYILEIVGSDRISTFQMRCLPISNWNENTLTCVGGGQLFDKENPTGVMFLNESIFKFTSSDEITEHWKVRYWSKSNAKIVEKSQTAKYSRK